MTPLARTTNGPAREGRDEKGEEVVGEWFPTTRRASRVPPPVPPREEDPLPRGGQTKPGSVVPAQALRRAQRYPTAPPRTVASLERPHAKDLVVICIVYRWPLPVKP